MTKYNEYKAKAKLLDRILYTLASNHISHETLNLPDRGLRLHIAKTDANIDARRPEATFQIWHSDKPGIYSDTKPDIE